MPISEGMGEIDRQEENRGNAKQVLDRTSLYRYLHSWLAEALCSSFIAAKVNDTTLDGRPSSK